MKKIYLHLAFKIMTFASLICIAACWLIYLTTPHSGSIDSPGNDSYWDTMIIISRIMTSFTIIFLAGFTGSVLKKDLPGSKILLRILLILAVAAVSLVHLWFAVFIFSGSGF